MSISKRYSQILKYKIKGQNIHFTGEKDERMLYIRQAIHEVLDVWGRKDPYDPIVYFKKKCLKSKILAEEIEDLKGDEE